ADEALLLLRMDTDIAPADLASGRAVPVGAECRPGVHDAPPSCAWKHCHEKYVWTPICFTTSPHHGLVWCYHEGKLKEVNLLISDHADDSTERDRAKTIFEEAGAEDISYTEEARV